jgi:serine/threonine-protein kinase
MPPDLEKQANAPEEVRAALEKIAASEAFGKSERPARFLRHLVETALRGDAHILKESVLGADVFDRPADWDPRLDPVVRQEASRLRKRLANYYSGEGSTDEVRIDLPVGSYVPVFARRSAEAAVEAPPARLRPVWPLLAAGAVCVALGAGAWRLLSRHESVTSIAVLPFTNLSSDAGDQYFSDGLTDEITDALSRVKTLRVIARSSSFQFRGKNADVREVGRTLNVTNILEGSVERSGDHVKIIAHLERASDGALVWSNTYERKTSDLFAVQSELAAGIAGGLKVAVGAAPARHAPSAEAHDLVMKGRYGLQQGTVASVAQAEADFQHAIDLDPQYADAYLGAGNAAYNRAGATGIYVRTEDEHVRAERYFRKALELDPELPVARAYLARLAMQYDWDWSRAEHEIQLALAGPPNAVAEYSYAMFLLFHGRFPEADLHLQRYQDLDPFSTATMMNVATARNLEGRFAQAREISQKVAAAYPSILMAKQLIGLTYIEEGHPELALADLEPMKGNIPFAPFREAMARARAGQREQALRLIRPYEDKYPDTGVSMQWFALVYSFMGDQPNTMKWLERSADRHEWGVLSIAIGPNGGWMRNTPEFRALVKRIGLER